MARPTRVGVRRRSLLALAAPLALAACGFRLRQPPDFAFRTLYTDAPQSSSLVNELKRQLAGTGAVEVLSDARQRQRAEVLLDVLSDLRERVVVGVNASGQVREVQLRLRFKFRLRTPEGKTLIPEVELLQERDVSYREAAALAKEAEEVLLLRDMQSDIVQQVMRRLAAVRQL